MYARDPDMRCPAWWCNRKDRGYAKVDLEEKEQGNELVGVSDKEREAAREKEVRSLIKGCPNKDSPWPEFRVSIFARLFFSWFEPLIELGSKASLELDDVWALDPGDCSEANSDEFWRLWQEEKARAASKSQEPWLGRTIVQFSWRRVATAAVLQLAQMLLEFAQPLIMMQILRIVEGTPAIVAPQLAWQLAVAIAVVKFMQMILSIHYRCLMNRMAFRIRCAVVAALFRKFTSLSTGGHILVHIFFRSDGAPSKASAMMSCDGSRRHVSTSRSMSKIAALLITVVGLGCLPDVRANTNRSGWYRWVYSYLMNSSGGAFLSFSRCAPSCTRIREAN